MVDKLTVDGSALARTFDNSKGALLSNDGCLEIYRDDSVPFIDFKTSISEDHDCRIQQASNGLTFITGGNGSALERMRIDSSGNVGIGVSSVIGKLHANDGSGAVLTLTRTSGATSGNLGKIRFGNTNIDSALASVTAIQDGATNNSALTFGTQSTGAAEVERMRIDSSGRLGIGTASPAQLLDIASTAPNMRFTDTVDGHSEIDGNAANLKFNADKGNTKVNSNISFAVDNAERMRINSSGNLGINTTSPGDLVEVKTGLDRSLLIRGNRTSSPVDLFAGNPAAAYGLRDMSFSANTLRFGTGASTGTTATERLRIDSSGAASFKGGTVLVEATSNTTNAQLSLGRPNSTSAGYIRYINNENAMAFRTSGSGEDMRLDSSGRLLLGTSSSNDIFQESQLQIEGNTSAKASLSIHQNQSAVDGPQLILGKSRGSGSVGASDILGDIVFAGNDGTDVNSRGAIIRAKIDGTPGSNDLPTHLAFMTTADGASSPTERMRISNNGELRLNTGGGNVDVGSGTTDGVTFYNPSNPSAGALQTSTNGGPAMYLRRRTSDGTIIDFRRDTTSVGTISVTTTATAYNTSSDYRLKENVVDIADGITRVKQLQPRRFNFIADADTTVDGFLAHEAQTVVPEAVTGTHNEVDDDGNAVMQGIDQSKLVPLLTAALQEAIAKIETLEQRLTDAGF